MATEFSREFFSENRIVKADLRAAHQLREEDIARIKAEVKKLYDATEVILNVSVDESLLSGYVLQVGDRVFDNSGPFMELDPKDRVKVSTEFIKIIMPKNISIDDGEVKLTIEDKLVKLAGEEDEEE